MDKKKNKDLETKKEKYEKIEIEIIKFDAEDIITLSGFDEGEGEP